MTTSPGSVDDKIAHIMACTPERQLRFTTFAPNMSLTASSAAAIRSATPGKPIAVNGPRSTLLSTPAPI